MKASRREARRTFTVPAGQPPFGGRIMNTRTIAIVALAIAVVLLIIFLL
jgi:hypothetical protein